jgi:hypothetical protein
MQKGLTMQAQFDRGRIALDAKAMFAVGDAAGIEVACLGGSVWITLDHDSRDVILQAGEVFCTTEHRKLLVYAFQDAVVSVRDRLAAPQPGVRRREAKKSSDWSRSPAPWAATRAATSA